MPSVPSFSNTASRTTSLEIRERGGSLAQCLASAGHNGTPTEMTVKAGNGGAAEWLGTFWPASAHIIIAAIGSGVLSLCWAIAQLGWVTGPAAMLLFAFVPYCTATLLAECYRTGDLETGKRNYTYMDAVRSNLGGAKVAFCGVIQYANLVGIAIGYTIAFFISMKAISRAGWFHKSGHAVHCECSSIPYMILYGFMLILLSQITDFDQIWWLSILAAVIYFTYSSIGLSLGIAQTISNGGVMGSLTGISIGAGVAIVCQSIQFFADVCCSYSYAHILIEIQDTIKAPPPSETKLMQKATRLSVATATIFYMLCKNSSIPFTIFGVVQLLFSLIPDFDQISWLSILAAVMSFTCCSNGLSISNGGLMGSLTAISIGIISTQKIWHTLWVNLSFAEYMRIGRRARTMPRRGAVKGSGRCIGRAREAVPAGRSHGIPTFRRAGIPTFRRTVRRTGDRSLPRRRCDWSRIMGSAVINTDESCVISASVMCMEAQYRRRSGNYHGANSCFLKVTPEAVESLKDMCTQTGAWKPYVGAPTVEDVLEVIRSSKGLRTVHDNVSLRLKSYVTFVAGELNPLEVTSMIQEKGPVIGVLYADDEAYLRSTVYRGHRAFPANHAVVCTGYVYVNGELVIIIMDNVAPGGPFRFVLHEAFEKFHVLTVVDASS